MGLYLVALVTGIVVCCWHLADEGLARLTGRASLMDEWEAERASRS